MSYNYTKEDLENFLSTLLKVLASEPVQQRLGILKRYIGLYMVWQFCLQEPLTGFAIQKINESSLAKEKSVEALLQEKSVIENQILEVIHSDTVIIPKNVLSYPIQQIKGFVNKAFVLFIQQPIKSHPVPFTAAVAFVLYVNREPIIGAGKSIFSVVKNTFKK